MGWSMSATLHAKVAIDALRMAISRRNPPKGLVHHSDRGVQYACRDCRELLEAAMEIRGMRQSMSRPGDRCDNAMMESPMILKGDPEEGVGTRPDLPQARGSPAGDLRVDRGLVPAEADPRFTRLRQPRSVRGGRESRIGSTCVSTVRVAVHAGTLRTSRKPRIRGLFQRPARGGVFREWLRECGRVAGKCDREEMCASDCLCLAPNGGSVGAFAKDWPFTFAQRNRATNCCERRRTRVRSWLNPPRHLFSSRHA